MGKGSLEQHVPASSYAFELYQYDTTSRKTFLAVFLRLAQVRTGSQNNWGSAAPIAVGIKQQTGLHKTISSNNLPTTKPRNAWLQPSPTTDHQKH